MALINRFGQRVKLVATNLKGGNTVFETDSLRIDFDIRHIPDFTRAKIDIYNLAPDTVKMLTSSEVLVSIYTALHEEDYTLIADRLFVSNGLEQKVVPHSVTSLYCFSKLRYEVSEVQVDVKVNNPSFRNKVSAVLQAGGFKGSISYVNFPKNFLDAVPPRPRANLKGSVESILKRECKANNVSYFLDGDNVLFVYLVDSGNVTQTEFETVKPYKLSTSNMRSSPSIGIASINISSNLDPNLYTSRVVDVTDLLTAGVSDTQDSLELAQGILKEQVAQNTRFQLLQVQHKGSNWTGSWLTATTGLGPTRGTHMNPFSWFE